MAHADNDVVVASADSEVAIGRPSRKRKIVNYAEKGEDDFEIIEVITKKVKSKTANSTVEPVVIDEGDDSPGVEITKVVGSKRTEEKKVKKRVAPKKSRKRGGIRYNEDGQEIRQREFETEPSDEYLAAKDRALTHAIHFVDRERCDTAVSPEEQFTITGSRDYTVHIKHIPKCTCPDHQFRGSSYHCKHITYVFVHVLKVREELAYQMALTSAELREIFDNAPMAPADRVAAEAAFDPNRKPIEGECPICYLDFEAEKEAISYCKAACGNNVHTECIGVWVKTKQREGRPATCPYCRERWVQG